MAENSYKQIIELQAKTAKAARDIDRFVREAEKKISSLQGVLEGKTAKGAARKRPLSVEERRKTAQQIAAEKVLIKLRQEAADVQNLGNKLATAALNNQLKINAATERRKNLLKALTRAGVSGDRAKEVKQLKEVAEANKNNVGILNSTNNALVKILETQREITRTDIAQDRVARKNAQGKQFDKRVKQLEAVGASQEALKKIEDERFKLADLNLNKQTDLARKQLAQVEELIRAQEELNKAYLQPTKQIASPIRGSKTLPGSPIAVEEAEKDLKKRNKLLDAEEQRLNRFAENGRRLREKGKREEEKRQRARQRAFKQTEAGALKLIRLSQKAGRLADKIQNQIPRQLALPSTEILKPAKKDLQLLDKEVRGKEARIQQRLERNAERNKQLEKETLDINKARLKALREMAKAKRAEGRRTVRLIQQEQKLKKENKERLEFLSSPIRGGVNFPGSPKFFEAQRQKRQTKSRDILTGAGFPLLFGGGPGAVVGGLLGGAVGGFEGSIALSAIGAQFDKTGETAKRLADAIKDPVRLLDELTNAGFQVSDSLKEQVESLNDQGLVLDAANLAIEEFANKIGNKGVKELQNFDAATDELREQLAKTSLIIFSEFAPAISAITRIISNFIKNLTGPEIQRLAANADPVAFARARDLARQQSEGQFLGGDPVKYEQTLTAESRKILARSAAPVLDPEQQEKLAKAQQKNLRINDLELQILRDKLNVVNSSGNILDENVYLAEQQLIINRTQLAIEKAGNNAQAVKVAKATEELELAQLTKRRREEQLRIERRIAEAIERRREAEIEAYNQAKNNLFIAKGQLAVSEEGNDLTKDAVYQAQRDLINRRASLAIGNAENDAAKDLAETNQQIALNNLDRSREEAIRNSRLQGLQAELSISKKIVDVNRQLVDVGQKGLIEPELFSRFEKSVTQKAIDQQVEEVGKALRSARTESGSLFTQEEISILENYYRTALTREQELQAAQKRRATLIDEINKKQADQDIVERFVAPVREIREQQEQSLQTQKDYNRLLLEGVLPSEAKRIAQFNEQVRLQKALIDVKLAEALVRAADLKDNKDLVKEYQKQLDLINALRKAKGEVEIQAAAGPGAAAPDQTPRDAIAARVGQLKEELKELTNIGNIVAKGADSIGAAFSTAFQEVVSGSKSAQQALADMFRSVADDFLRMAAEIIAKQLIMIALQTLLKALGGAAASGSSTTPPTTLPGSATQTGSGLNINGVDQGINLDKAANGGPVKSGNPYIIGERGPELFVPRSNGRVVPNGRFGGGGGGDVNVVVNVDAKGSNAQGSDRDAKTLGSAIGIAVRSELVKQKRPGGLLAS